MQQLSFFNPPPPPKRLPLIGYNLFAKHLTKGWMSTYREAPTLEIAFNQCLEEFPIDEGWTGLSVKNLNTNIERWL